MLKQNIINLLSTLMEIPITGCSGTGTAAGYELFPGIGSYKLHTVGKNWHDARDTCTKEGTYLAIINSEAESKVLKNMFAKHPDTNHNNSHNDYAWLGVNDIEKEGHFITIFGQPLNETGFTHWYESGQPDNYKADEMHPGEDCVSVYRNGGLNDYFCFWKLAFFCEQL